MSISGKSESKLGISIRHRMSLALALVLGAYSGCGGGGHIYSPRSLPVELQAVRSENPRTVDLSKLANYSMSNELIDRGDILNITVSAGYGGEKVESTPVRVGDDGVANIPVIGRVELAGMELQAAEHVIVSAAVERGLYRNPAVTVTLEHRRTNSITVVGAVNKPGVVHLPRGSSTLLAAIVAAEGLSDEAGTEVEIRRPHGAAPNAPQGDRTAASGPQLTSYSSPQGVMGNGGGNSQPVSFKINLVSAAKQGDGGQFLYDGDVIMVERRDPQPIHVMGLVLKPNQYEIQPNQDLHVLDAIAMAGGMSLNVADKIHVIRSLPGQKEPAVIELSFKEAKKGGPANLRLAPGDVVSVEDTPVTVVMDTIRTFFRVGFTSAMPGL